MNQAETYSPRQAVSERTLACQVDERLAMAVLHGPLNEEKAEPVRHRCGQVDFRVMAVANLYVTPVGQLGLRGWIAMWWVMALVDFH
jgi:hypothetical protein